MYFSSFTCRSREKMYKYKLWYPETEKYVRNVTLKKFVTILIRKNNLKSYFNWENSTFYIAYVFLKG